MADYIQQDISERYITARSLDTFLKSNVHDFGSNWRRKTQRGIHRVTVKRSLTVSEIAKLQRESFFGVPLFFGDETPNAKSSIVPKLNQTTQSDLNAGDQDQPGSHDELRKESASKPEVDPCTQTLGSAPHFIAIHDFYHYALGYFAESLRWISCTQCQNSQLSQSLRKSLSLLYMWAQGLDLWFIETVLDQETGLQASIIRELAAICKLAHHFYQDRAPMSAEHLCHQYVAGLSIRFSLELDSDSSSDSSTSSDTDDKDEADKPINDDHQNHLRYCRLLKTHVACLMDLLPTLEHCCNVEISPVLYNEVAASGSDAHLYNTIRPYVMQVQDKFKLINKKLAERLGEANWNRYQHLHSLNIHVKSGEVLPSNYTDGAVSVVDSRIHERSVATFRPFSEFHDSGLGTSLPARSHYNPSVASHTSFQSTQSAAGRGTVRVPPTPAAVDKGKPFECSICGQTLSHIRNRVEWKIHVFADIQPYICTSEHCTDTKTTFSTRKQWAAHELQQHRNRVVWRCFQCKTNLDTETALVEHLTAKHNSRLAVSEAGMKAIMQAARTVVTNVEDLNCSFCLKADFKTQRDWTTHVGRHMEEIALIVLPRSDESDSDDDHIDSGLDSQDDELSEKGTLGPHAQRQGVASLWKVGQDAAIVRARTSMGEKWHTIANSILPPRDADEIRRRYTFLSLQPRLFACPVELFRARNGYLLGTKTCNPCHATFPLSLAGLWHHIMVDHGWGTLHCNGCFRFFLDWEEFKTHCRKCWKQLQWYGRESSVAYLHLFGKYDAKDSPYDVWCRIFTSLHASARLPDTPYPSDKSISQGGSDKVHQLSPTLSSASSLEPFPDFLDLADRNPPPEEIRSTRASARAINLNNREYILDLADPSRPSSISGEPSKRLHPATFQCHLCPKRFTRAYNLRSHLRTHTDDKPFVCAVCGKAFARQFDRKRHEGMHTAEKKFICKGELEQSPGETWGCGRRFARADALGRHLRSEAGRVCIKPLLDEETRERALKILEEQKAAHMGGAFTLPAALLAQYPALQNIDWSAFQVIADDPGELSDTNYYRDYHDPIDYSYAVEPTFDPYVDHRDPLYLPYPPSSTIDPFGTPIIESKATTDKAAEPAALRDSTNILNPDTASNDNDEAKYCYCNQPAFGNMITCENPYCSRKRFHLVCLRMKQLPENHESWTCSSCLDEGYASKMTSRNPSDVLS